MKNTGIIFQVLLLFAASPALLGQTLLSGDIRVLRAERRINLQYDYSGMAVGEFATEEAYIAHRKAEKTKEAGLSFEEWLSKWTGNRTSIFQPQFEKALNAELDKYGVRAMQYSDNPAYTLIVHTTFTEIGWSGFGAKKDAVIDLTITLVKTTSLNEKLAVIDLRKMKSRRELFHYGQTYDASLRVGSCYERAGEDLGEFIVKEVFK